jgi:hypothetical protein
MSKNKKINKTVSLNQYEKELKETNEIIGMMEDVFGHRVTSWSPKDTAKLKNKLRQPVSDKEKEEYVDIVEPLMNKKSFVPKEKDKFLDSFIDLDTRISQKDYEPTIDLDTYKKVREPLRFKSKEAEPGSEKDDTEEESPTKK